MSVYTDYYNQCNQQGRSYNSGAGIEDGKTVRYVKLVLDDSDFERFADIFVNKLMDELDRRGHDVTAAKEKVIPEAITNKSPFEDKYTDLPLVTQKPILKTNQEPGPNDWKSYLDAYDMDKITIGVLIKSWMSFNRYTNIYVAKKIQSDGYEVSDAAVSTWALDKAIPGKRYHAALKKLMNLTDSQFDNAIRNSHILKAQKRVEKLKKE